MSRIFEEYQQPVIQNKIVSCPQNWEYGFKKANRYPNLKRGVPAVFMKLNMDENNLSPNEAKISFFQC
jgi:hypothetical protein